MNDHEILMALQSRFYATESMFFQLRTDVQNMEFRHKQELQERDNTLIVASTEAVDGVVRLATESEIRLRTNLERLAASTSGPIAERIRQVLDSYKEIA